MHIFSKLKFWSFLVIGVVAVFIGGYLFPFGPDKRPLAELLLLVGAGQLLIFAVLFYFRYRKRNGETAKS